MKYGDKIAAAVIVALLVLGGWLWSGCTPAGKQRFEAVLLTVAEYAVKFGAEAVERELSDTSGGEAP